MILSPSTNERVCRQLVLSWGDYPVFLTEEQAHDALYSTALDTAIAEELVGHGDFVVVINVSERGRDWARGIHVETVSIAKS